MPLRIYYNNLHIPASRLISSHTPLNVTSVSCTETFIKKKVLRIQEFIYKAGTLISRWTLLKRTLVYLFTLQTCIKIFVNNYKNFLLHLDALVGKKRTTGQEFYNLNLSNSTYEVPWSQSKTSDAGRKWAKARSVRSNSSQHPGTSTIYKNPKKKNTETKGRLHYAKHKQQTMSPSC